MIGQELLVEDMDHPERKLLRDLEGLVTREFKNHRPAVFFQKALGLSANSLSNLTQLYYGRSLHNILTEKLLAASKYYLTSTSLSFKWITYELGFQDPAYFSRWFKKLTGDSPKVYRRKHFRLKLINLEIDVV